jgi:1-acyl-sn-glycerol-3-phosphate acyltransferase
LNEDTSAYWRKLLELDKSIPSDVPARYRPWHAILRPLFYAIVSVPLKYYCRLTVSGLENLPKKPPYILAANHGSSMDFACVAYAMGKRKEEIFPITTKLFYDNPWARFWIKVAANAVRIDTVEDYFPALRAAAEVLRAGQAIYVNPEGLRTTDGELLPFRPGVGVLAVETGAPIVPVYISGTWKALPTGKIFPRPYPVSVTFGKPMDVTPYLKKEKTEPAYDVYKEVTEELRSQILGMINK